MTTQSTADELKAQSEHAMRALDALTAKQAQADKKLDAIDLDAIGKMSTDINGALEASQKARQAAEGEKQAREQLARDLTTQVEAIKGLTGASNTELEKRFGTIEATLERISLNPGEQDETKSLEKKWRAAFNDFARKEGTTPVNFEQHLKFSGNDEYKTLSVISNPDGGYLVDPVRGAMLQTRVWETSPMRSLASTITIGTDAIEMPVDVDEATSAGWVGEVDDRSGTTGTPQIYMQRIPVYEQWANPMVTQKILDDGAFDVEAWLQGKIADKFSRVENTAFLLGASAKAPRGLLTLPNVTTPGAFQVNAIEQVTSATSLTIAYNDLIALQNALKGPYQANAKWLFQRAVNATILGIKDGQGRPIFNMDYSANAGVAGTIFGKEVVFAADMPAIAANSLSIAYGDFKQTYLIVDRVGIRILRYPYSKKGFVQFYTTKRVGGDILNYEATKLLKTHN